MSVPMLLYPQMTAKAPYSVEAPGVEAKEGEGIPRRHPSAKDGLISVPEEGVNTVYDIITSRAQKYSSRKCMGWRKLIQMHEETKMIKKVVDGEETEIPKKWMYFEKSGYDFITFAEYEQLVHKIGSGLRTLGLEPGDRVQIFAATSAKWLSTAHGACSQSMPIVTAYDTLGPVGLTHSLKETEAKAILIDAHLFPNLVNPLKEAKEVRYVIYNDAEGEAKVEHLEKMRSEHPEIRLISYDDLVKLGAENPSEPIPPSAEDLCCIMYTSGSTGTPKGVTLLHSNVIGSVAGVSKQVGHLVGEKDVLLTYLPLAHILEFVFENSVIFCGGTMGYGAVKTLTDASMRNSLGDIRELKPTILVGVPQVWESVKKGIESRVKSQPALSQKLFWAAMAAKSFCLSTGLPGAGLLDAIVFKKIKDATGGRLKLCMSGGGALSKETQHFISMAICPMIIGYGLTETGAMGTVMNPYEWTTETVGGPIACVEMKLVDFPDAGYHSKNDPPQGEIWIRGAPVARSYFNNEKETAEAMTEDGWFKTGDIGEWTKNGHLKIIDRKKNLVKTLTGEYIALEKLESVYRSCSLVSNICVHAESQHSKPVAIIFPMEANIKKLAKDKGIDGELDEIAHNSKIQSLVLKDMLATGRTGGLVGFELLDGVVISPEEWTPQNGLVTAAMKLNRKALNDKYKDDIQAAYQRAGN